MNYLRTILIWLNYCLKWIFSKRRFVAITPPFLKTQLCYDRASAKMLQVHIRDPDDWIQLEHIFLNEEFKLDKTGRQLQIRSLHRRIIDEGGVPLIVDLGANIGLASKYLDWIYPGSKILAVEPDSGNCQIARQNLPYNASLFTAAISSQAGTAELIDMGRRCAFRVKSGIGGGVTLMTVDEVLAAAPEGVPFLIKIDIEGFESDLFANNTDWLDLFPVLLIKLHDWMLPNALVTKNFLQEIARREREFMHFDGYVASLKFPEDTYLTTA